LASFYCTGSGWELSFTGSFNFGGNLALQCIKKNLKKTPHAHMKNPSGLNGICVPVLKVLQAIQN